MTTADVKKAIGLPESVSTDHDYVFRSGDYGMYLYWYVDESHNYWCYTNAPKNNRDYDRHAGEILMCPDQPLPHLHPSFFTKDGKKRHIAVPAETNTIRNTRYDSKNLRRIWYERFSVGDTTKYVYLDADVKENVALWVSHQLRVCDSKLTAYRKYATKLFLSESDKDKCLAGILMLADQAFFLVPDLISATVADISFMDNTVVLLNRKFNCDPLFFDFLLEQSRNRSNSSPLFSMQTVHGRKPFGLAYVNAVLQALKIQPKYLLAWHISHTYSRIVNKLFVLGKHPDSVEKLANQELKDAFATSENIHFFVDNKLREILLASYGRRFAQVEKSFIAKKPDRMGVPTVLSDLDSKKVEEAEFSAWLHAEPLHDLTPAEERQVEEAMRLELSQ